MYLQMLHWLVPEMGQCYIIPIVNVPILKNGDFQTFCTYVTLPKFKHMEAENGTLGRFRTWKPAFLASMLKLGECNSILKSTPR